ncbi:HDOD domain-containing protein [Saccharophagus degradans]|uniref:HDOD domain-containing protein n=1 Tax=Saccharophagus degradans TaxID=86304 RepID=A0AAW7XA66_9GAMM|nr:HDOD domain-containing protein [Saccharophagus degradans]MDO6423418.1 HDOD domain-containing protein [Saccharophagus degradans]MDO6606823.1 HDOD domain-containing protein [Saccharophagus degradans]
MTAQLTDDQIKTILQGIAIPPQPQILVDLQMEQLDPNCSVLSVAKLISQDVGLSGSILKTVNSSFFQHASNITSITQAVNLLGIKTVVNLVNAHSIKGELADEDIIALGRFWDSAMEVASTSLVIAKQISMQNPDEAYTLGLFHNCGIPLLMKRYDDYQSVIRQCYAEQTISITEKENELIRTNHAVVGYYVGKAWNLPKYLCEAIHDHHNPINIFTDEFADNRKKNLLAVLKMAEFICGCHATIGGQSENYEWHQVKQYVLDYVGMTEYDFEHLHATVIEMGLGSTDYYS